MFTFVRYEIRILLKNVIKNMKKIKIIKYIYKINEEITYYHGRFINIFVYLKWKMFSKGGKYTFIDIHVRQVGSLGVYVWQACIHGH